MGDTSYVATAVWTRQGATEGAVDGALPARARTRENEPFASKWLRRLGSRRRTRQPRRGTTTTYVPRGHP